MGDPGAVRKRMSRSLGASTRELKLAPGCVPIRLSLSQDATEIIKAQDKARLRLRQYPERRLALKRLWIDCSAKAGLCKICSSDCRGYGYSSCSTSRRRPTGGYYYHRSGDSDSGYDESQWPVGFTGRQLVDMMTRDLTPEDYEMLLLLDEGVKKTKTLSVELVARLPSVTGKKIQGETCGVCLVEFEDDDEVKAIPTCGHLYHGPCITHWLTECKSTCPLDGQEVGEADLVPDPDTRPSDNNKNPLGCAHGGTSEA